MRRVPQVGPLLAASTRRRGQGHLQTLTHSLQSSTYGHAGPSKSGCGSRTRCLTLCRQWLLRHKIKSKTSEPTSAISLCFSARGRSAGFPQRPQFGGYFSSQPTDLCVVMNAAGSQGTIARGHGSQRRRIDSPAFNAGTVRSCGIQSGPRDTARPMLSVKKTSSKLTPGMARCTFGAVMPAGMMPRRKSTRVRVGISRTATRWNVCRLAVVPQPRVYLPWWLGMAL